MICREIEPAPTLDKVTVITEVIDATLASALTNLHPADRVAEYTAAGLWNAELWSDLLARHAETTPDALALVDQPTYGTLTGVEPQRLTRRAVHARARSLAALLFKRGVRATDVVAVQLPNGADLTVTYLAATQLGAVVTPFPVQYREYELGQMCQLAEVSAFVTTSRMGEHRLGERATAVAGEVPGLHTVLTFGPDEVDGAVRADEDPPQERTLQELDEYRATLQITANDAVTICWTSGTESRPKGVLRCPNDWQPMSLATVDGARLTHEDVILNPFPMVNMAGIAGMLIPWLITGSTLVQHHPFDAETFFRQLVEESVTHTVAPPAVLVRALETPQLTPERLASVRTIGSGSAPLPPSMIRAFGDRFDIDVINYFGSNEGISLVSDAHNVPDPTQRATLFRRVGSPDHHWDNRAFDGSRMKLVDPVTREIITEPGRPGEVLLKGPGIFSGYLPGTAGSAPFDEDGWFCSGDLMQLVADESGDARFLQFVDRAKDLIIRGGMNISPAEIESLAIDHPSIAEIAVIGVPDDTLGERTRAVVALHPGTSLTLEELIEHLRAHQIATYKLPESLEVVEALPRNPVGKVLKRDLRESQ